MAADQRAQLQTYTHQLGQRDSEFAAMRQRMDDLRYFQTAGCVWRIQHEPAYFFRASFKSRSAAMCQLVEDHWCSASCVLPIEAWMAMLLYM